MDIAWLLCLARAVSAVSRLSLGPVLPLLAEDLSIDLAGKGQLLSAFSTGYLLTQIAGGRLADGFGARGVVLLALVATAAGLGLAPAAAAAGKVEGLSAVYFTIGALNGPLFPACSVMLRTTPPQGRARASAIVDAGGTIGGCLAIAVCPAIATAVGWEMLFYIQGVVAVATAVVWLLFAHEPLPAKIDHPRSSSEDNANNAERAAEMKMKGGKVAVEPASSSVPVDAATAAAASASVSVHRSESVQLLSTAGPWALFWAHAVFNYSNYFLNAWLPSVFVEQFPGMTAASAGAFLMWPEIFGVASRFAAADFSERVLLKKRGMPLVFVRRYASAGAFTVQGVCLALAVRQGSPMACTVLLIAAASASGCHSCGFKANYLDLTTQHSGLLSGVGNTVASVASAVGPMVTAATLSAYPGNWGLLFTGLLALNLLGALVVMRYLSVENLDKSIKSVGSDSTTEDAANGSNGQSKRLKS